jgi:hypothetical protein
MGRDTFEIKTFHPASDYQQPGRKSLNELAIGEGTRHIAAPI